MCRSCFPERKRDCPIWACHPAGGRRPTGGRHGTRGGSAARGVPASRHFGDPPYLNAYYALGAALRLDRIKQWGEILEASQLPENDLFLLQGPHDQNVGLFVERIQRFFSQELALPRKLYRVSFNIQGQTPRNGADWLAHMRDAFRSGTRPLGAELRQLVQKQALFVLLGQNPLPLDRLEPSTPRPYW